MLCSQDIKGRQVFCVLPFVEISVERLKVHNRIFSIQKIYENIKRKVGTYLLEKSDGLL